MGGHPKRPEPQLARTDFESMTHEQLAAMLDSASTSGASHLSTKLSKAASTISKIGDDLMKHVKGLEWQGEGGDAFRDWGGQTAGATLRLGQYADVASRWMGTVSQAISEAKAAMPDTSETTRAKKDLSNAHATIAAAREPGSHNDPEAQKLAQTARIDASSAQQRIDAARGEAIQQMRKLAQTYEYSAQEVNSVPPPTFPPPAGKTGSSDWWRAEDKSHVSGADTSLGSGSRASSTQVVRGDVTATHGATHPVYPTDPPEVSSRPAWHGTHVPQPVSLGIDSTDTLPRTPPALPAAPSTTASVPHGDAPLTNQSSALPPGFNSGGRETGINSPPRLPASPRMPQVLRSGDEAGNVPRMPRETGITGGRPISNTGRGTSGLSRGTVIGKENTPQSRTPMGGRMYSGATGGEGARTGSNQSGGRRLASERGGIVGDRAARPTPTGGRPFTPGGSGLVRPASSETSGMARDSAVGRTGTGISSTSRKGRQSEGRRPDYLAEDEETWTRDSRRTLPPVID